MNTQRKQLAVILLLVSFLCQGMASLIYQVSWEQAMEKIVGLAMPTMAMLISIFLIGMGLGAYLFSKIQLNHHTAGKFYCTSQFFLLALGLVFAGSNGLSFLSGLSVNNIDWLPFAYLIRLSLLCLYLLPTAMLIGAGFPLLLSVSGFYQLNLSARQIYLVNLIGSAMGAILTGFVLLPHMGIDKSTEIAAIIHLLAGVLIIAVSWICGLSITVKSGDNAISPRSAQHTLPLSVDGTNTGMENTGSINLAPTVLGQDVDSNADMKSKRVSQVIFLLIIVAVAGFFNMFLELIFIRYYSLIMGSSTSAYSLVLTTVLLALACGTFVTGQKVQSRLSLSLLFLLAGAFLLFTSFFFSQLPFIFVGLKCLIGFLFTSVLIFIWTIFPVCLCLGAVLPCCFNAAEMEATLSPVKPGQIYAVNLFAAVIGCLAGGTIAIPVLNLFHNHAIYLAIILSALVLVITGIIILSPIILPSQRLSLITVVLTVLLCIVLWPLITSKSYWNEAALTAGLDYLSLDDLKTIRNLQQAVDLPQLFYKEGLNSTVSVTTNPKLNVICLKTDGQMEAALPYNLNLPAPSSDEKTQIMLGLLPSCFDQIRPENAFLLGYGTGITARSILLNANVKNLTIAELEPAVIEGSHSFARYCDQIFNINQMANKKMQIKIIDGRSLLSLLNKCYDIIVSQPGEPSRSSCSHLYTLEFWQMAKRRLEPNGVFCQWLPLYGIDRSDLISLFKTFLCVFPNTFVIKLDRSAELILVGLNGKPTEIPIAFPPVTKQLLIRLGFSADDSTLNRICIPARLLSDGLTKYTGDKQTNCLNRDDFPFVQYRLQARLAKEGFSISNDVEKMISDSFSLNPSPTFPK